MHRALIGTYTEAMGHTSGGGPGVQLVAVGDAGDIAPVGSPLAIRNASFICRNAVGDRAYVISEVVDHGGAGPDGCITTLAVDAAAGRLDVLDARSSTGPGPAHCGLNPAGTHLVTANYVGGNAAVYPLDDRGIPQAPAAVLPHTGTGPNAARQEAPHPHAAVVSPDGRWLYVVDLGIDRVVGYLLDGAGGATPIPDAGATLPPGSGPRHLAFAPDGRTAYLDLELSGGVCVLAFDGVTGRLEVVQTLRSSVADAARYPSEIAVSPDGRHVVVANRAVDVLTAFAVSPADGTLTAIHDARIGNTPRHFAFTPGGGFIVLAEQDGHRVTSHRLDSANGRITPTGHGWDTPSPCAVCFLPG